jgi:thiamine-phosphate pyrophosphorylase
MSGVRNAAAFLRMKSTVEANGYRMRGLYAIVDVDALVQRGISVAAFAEAVLDARPAALQLRDKTGGARRTLELLRAIQPLCARAGVPLFANDRPDLAVLARCDGVHVGQDDLPVERVRELALATGAPLRVGLSTHDAGQLAGAFEAGAAAAPDYAALGPIFPTATKERPSPVVGLDALRELSAWLAANRPGVPLVAIGGVTLETAPAVGALCDAAAVIGALLPASGGAAGLAEARDRARALHEAIVGGRA